MGSSQFLEAFHIRFAAYELPLLFHWNRKLITLLRAFKGGLKDLSDDPLLFYYRAVFRLYAEPLLSLSVTIFHPSRQGPTGSKFSGEKPCRKEDQGSPLSQS
nr:PREDICTED: uncharacterized protein LOC109031981 [Bemisia tabaci]